MLHYPNHCLNFTLNKNQICCTGHRVIQLVIGQHLESKIFSLNFAVVNFAPLIYLVIFELNLLFKFSIKLLKEVHDDALPILEDERKLYERETNLFNCQLLIYANRISQFQLIVYYFSQYSTIYETRITEATIPSGPNTGFQ